MEKKDIENKINYIKEKLETLSLAIKDYKKSKGFEKYKCLKTIERDSEEIIELSTKINNIILEEKEIFANSYRESFEKLEIFECFRKIDLKKLSNLAGFRNRLAHDYMTLDENITLKTSENLLELFPEYILCIIKLINS